MKLLLSTLLTLIMVPAIAGAGWWGELEFGKILEEDDAYYSNIELGYRFDGGWFVPEVYTGVYVNMQRLTITFKPAFSLYYIGSKVWFGPAYVAIQHGCRHANWSGDWTMFYQQQELTTAVTQIGMGVRLGERK